MVKWMIYSFCIFSWISIHAQSDQILVNFSPSTELGKRIHLDTEIESFRVDVLKYYVGNFSLYADGVRLITDSSYHLVNCNILDTNIISIAVPPNMVFDQLEFNVGIDSVTNVSGAFEGDLDPINGMYWTWNTGYINSKIEGSYFQNESETDFKFHLGGYLPPFETMNTVRFRISQEKILNVHVDIGCFLANLYIQSHKTVMSPSKSAVKLSKYFSQCFFIE